MPFLLRLAVSFVVAGAAAGAPLCAQVQYPNAVAVDEAGDVFIADRGLPGIWKLSGGKLEKYFEGSRQFRTPLNSITTLAFGADGSLLAGDSATREVYRFDAAGKPTPLTGGTVGVPLGIAVGSAGELYVSDLELHTVWKVPAGGGKPEAFAKLQGVAGIALDGKQQLWALSRSGSRLVRLTSEGKKETVIGPGTFEFPHTILFGENGAAYISDGYARAVWKIAGNESPQKWVAGPPLRNPVGIAWKQDTLLVADPGARAVFQIAPDGKITPLLPEGAATPE